MSQPETPVEKPTVVLTLGLKALLDNDGFVKSVYAAKPDLDRLLQQLQLDSTTPENMHEIGPMCAALRKVQEALFLVEKRGEVLRKAAEKTQKK